MRKGLLNAYLFYCPAEVRMMSEKWQLDYNTKRPHKSLGYLSPVRYAELYYQRLGKDPDLYLEQLRKALIRIKMMRKIDEKFTHIAAEWFGECNMKYCLILFDCSITYGSYTLSICSTMSILSPPSWMNVAVTLNPLSAFSYST